MHLDGTTFNPTVFTAVLGKSLAHCHMQAIVKFKTRPNNLPDDLKNTNMLYISNNKKYLFDLCKAVEKGQVSEFS